jgi:hypothetical protein
MSHPVVRDQRLAVAIGVGCFLAGWWFLYDAWEGRGLNTPKPLRAFTWW